MTFMPTIELAHKLISEQFPQYSHLPISDVAKQGHDNRTYRLGSNMLIRLPTDAPYALKVPKEQELLPLIQSRLSTDIPCPLHMGSPSEIYPYHFSIYKWLEGDSINHLELSEDEMLQLAHDLASFLKELESITDVVGPKPGQHNWWRGDHVSVYDKGAREQIAELCHIIDAPNALRLWEQACSTTWSRPDVWIHGDFAIGNILMADGKLSAVIDFGGCGVGDPACDLVIAWTYFSGKARDIFIASMNMDRDTWTRARAWALWKATFELCQIKDKKSHEAEAQIKIIRDVLNG